MRTWYCKRNRSWHIPSKSPHLRTIAIVVTVTLPKRIMQAAVEEGTPVIAEVAVSSRSSNPESSWYPVERETDSIVAVELAFKGHYPHVLCPRRRSIHLLPTYFKSKGPSVMTLALNWGLGFPPYTGEEPVRWLRVGRAPQQRGGPRATDEHWIFLQLADDVYQFLHLTETE